MGLRSRLLCASLIGAAAFSLQAQNQTAVNLSPKLLPDTFGAWKIGSAPIAPVPEPDASLVNAKKAALEEANPQRSQVSDYYLNGRHMHVEAIEFADRTGAYSAYTLVKPPNMREGKDVGAQDSVGDNAVLFTDSASLVLAFPATNADFPALKALSGALPKAAGNKGIDPLLPSFVPSKGLVNGSIRYATGPATYSAQGGVLPANSIGWEKSAEAVTASYADKHGKETLTLLLYPTPTLAGAHQHAIERTMSGMGPSFANAKVRRELELVMLASGDFPADEAQKLVENIHMRQQLSFDKDVQPVFHTEVQKTASLLVNIAVLCGIGMAAAVLLGLFLGGGRAAIRVMRGKPAAVEPEFLSLHLDPQNKPAHFEG